MIVDDVISAYKRGVAVHKIMTAFNISAPTLYKILDDNNVPRRTKELMDGVIELICSMHKKRRRNYEIANVTGLTRQRVSYLIGKHCKAPGVKK